LRPALEGCFSVSGNQSQEGNEPYISHTNVDPAKTSFIPADRTSLLAPRTREISEMARETREKTRKGSEIVLVLELVVGL
jgi:hypothetical protein